MGRAQGRSNVSHLASRSGQGDGAPYGDEMNRILRRPPLDLGGDAASQAAALTRGCSQVLPEGGLQEKLAEGRPLRIKLGLDPTAPDLHLGHSIVLQRLRELDRKSTRLNSSHAN